MVCQQTDGLTFTCSKTEMKDTISLGVTMGEHVERSNSFDLYEYIRTNKYIDFKSNRNQTSHVNLCGYITDGNKDEYV